MFLIQYFRTNGQSLNLLQLKNIKENDWINWDIGNFENEKEALQVIRERYKYCDGVPISIAHGIYHVRGSGWHFLFRIKNFKEEEPLDWSIRLNEGKM